MTRIAKSAHDTDNRRIDAGRVFFPLTVEDWMEDAKCYGAPIGSYDTSRLPNANSPRHRVLARRKCVGCPVVGECASYAIRTFASGVVMASVPLGDDKNDHKYAELRSIAGAHLS